MTIDYAIIPAFNARKLWATAMLEIRLTQWKRILLWLILAVLALLVSYFGIRSYLSPEMLFSFSNSFAC